MKRISTLALTLVIVSTSAIAQSSPAFRKLVSPVRPIGTDYRTLIHQRFANLNRPFTDPFDYTTALDEKGPQLANELLTKVPEVDMATLERVFVHIRDTQFLSASQPDHAWRRLTWLFPDDGCYARAQLGGKLALAEIPTRPAKLYIFGNLIVNTPNSPVGQVSWWYHVAPALRVGSDIYVIDPAIEPSRALKINEWKNTMGPGSVEYALCDSHSYVPTTQCHDAEDSDQIGYMDARNFLNQEWMRVQQLGRDPERELGEHPPWKP